jgi:hypothetical protein
LAVNQSIGSDKSEDSDDQLKGDEENGDEDAEAPEMLNVAVQAFIHALVQPQLEVDNDMNIEQDEGDNNLIPPAPAIQSQIELVQITQDFIQDISSATLFNGKLGDEIIEQLQHPVKPAFDMEDPDIRLSIDLYIACGRASQWTYQAVRESILRRFPDVAILSYYLVNKLVTRITGVISIRDDMCINACHAYTGPFADLENCHVCAEPRYDPGEFELTGKKIPRKQMSTIPLGPQAQALRCSEYGANAMQYRQHKTQEILNKLNDQNLLAADFVYDDVFSGSDVIRLADNLDLTADDTVVSFSIDGAQLTSYQQKKTDTWIGIWMVNDFDPSTRYKKKHVLPAFIVPAGPNKPKILDSFLYRSFHHLSALQRNNNGAGLPCWDALRGEVINSRIAFLLGNADAVALPELDGRVGHHGAHGCRISCNMKGRHKPNSGHYFAAHLQPNNYDVQDCNHLDIDIRNLSTPSPEIYAANLQLVVASHDQNDYERNRKTTGISKPSLLSGLVPTLMLPIPLCFSVDLMHLLFINIPELLVSLWQGKIKCEVTDDKTTWDWVTLIGPVWKTHGQLVADSTPYFPSSFHRPPRNPAEKISSGYKATEYFLYIFGLGPGFFRPILPQIYWQNFCKLVHAARILIQRKFTGAQVREAQYYAVQFVEEYETLYYQRRVDRLHFCRPSLHTLLHCAHEATRVGPGAFNSQFTMERSIGDLVKDIRQHSNPLANLCEIALRQSQLNALKTIHPVFDYDKSSEIPKYARDLHNGYYLLRPRDRSPFTVTNVHQVDIIQDELHTNKIIRWGRIRLPTGQIARSLMSESRRRSVQKRNSRNVKVCLDWVFFF